MHARHLGDLVRLVGAQSGKKIAQADAAKLIEVATRIRRVIACSLMGRRG